MFKVTDRGMDLVWNGGDVRLPKSVRWCLRVAARPDSGWCAGRQPTWERAFAVASEVQPIAEEMGLRLRIHRQRRSGLWAIYASAR